MDEVDSVLQAGDNLMVLARLNEVSLHTSWPYAYSLDFCHDPGHATQDWVEARLGATVGMAPASFLRGVDLKSDIHVEKKQPERPAKPQKPGKPPKPHVSD
jgi:hypothetical protein